MKFVRNTLSCAGIAGITFALAACGGGGSSGTASSGTTLAAFAITSANMQDVGAQGYSTTANLNTQVGGSTSAFVTGVTVDTAPAGLVGVTMQELYRALNVPAANQAVGVTTSQTVQCANGGSMLVSANVASSNGLAAGDSITLTASSCKESGYTLNGSMSVTFKSVTGTPGESSSWSGSFAVNYTNFSVSEGASGDTASATGDLSINVNQTSLGAASFTISGNALKLSTTHNGSSSSITVNSFSYTGSLKAGIVTYNASFGVTGTLNKLGSASFNVKTITDFKQSVTGFPTQGALKITGGDNSSLTLTVIDSTNVKLDLDKNGDGVTDETVTTTWASLQSRL